MDSYPCDRHLKNLGHKLNEHAKFTTIEKINNACLPKQQRGSLLEQREDFWILRLETVSIQEVCTYP